MTTKKSKVVNVKETKVTAANSVAATLKARGSVHGDFTQNSAITQNMKEVVREQGNWEDLTDDKREAIDMILHKISRIVSGNPEHKDHWHDIAGYAKLAEDRCSGE